MKKYDALVIGASVGGLSTAALLAAAGKRVLVLERQAQPPDPIGPVYALDPLLLSQLRLSARGLRFVSRDLALALPLGALPQMMLGRDRHATARELGVLGAADAKAWAPYRQQVHALARQLRRWWWSALEEGSADWVLERQGDKALFARLSLTGADAFLTAYFQSDALVAALLFDASAGGFHVSEPGSALALVWRAAQEMAGLEGAASMPAPGTLIWSLIKAAGATDFRCCANVTGIVSKAGAATGVRLATGEEIEAPVVFSSLPGRATQMLSGGLASLPPASGIGEARLLISLRQKIAFPNARLILAERSGIYADAHEAARAGRLGAELPMELAAAEADASGVAKIAVTLRPVPALLRNDDRVQLATRAVQALSRQVPGAAALVSGVRFASSSPGARATLAQLLAPSKLRIKTKIAGLYLCGADAEPLACLSGRAARIAAALALKSE
jgi:phytoene dehydrogenase-like protein